MTRNNASYFVAFSHCMGIGPLRFDRLLNHFKDVDKAYNASQKELRKLFGRVLTDKFIQFRNEFNIEEKLEEFKNKRIVVLTREDRRFPRPLKEISDSPICLYVKGDIDDFDFEKHYLFAVVGTRKPTSYGVNIARKLTYELAFAGFTIVSGLALGIDAAAHTAALDAKAKTIAILGCGVDIAHPPSNKYLYDKIIQTGGLIISEFPPGMISLKGLFIARNRLISGLSRGILVVEGAKDSGALTTARFGAEQGKEVFAVPGPITSEMSEAPNLLLKEGVRMVTSIDDILQELQIKIIPKQKKHFENSLTKDQTKIIELLSQEPKSTDEISFATKISTSVILQTLSTLEMSGVVEKNSEGKYQMR